MIEIPEAVVLTKQINEAIAGKQIRRVTAAKSPHKFAWYHGDPQDYGALLAGRVISEAIPLGGFVEIRAEDAVLLFAEGVALRFHLSGQKRPQKHQLEIEFHDSSALTASVQMYGGLWAFAQGDAGNGQAWENQYYALAKEKPSPLSQGFTRAYFDSITVGPGLRTEPGLPKKPGLHTSKTVGPPTGVEKLSAKALLATGQRIPGLGNGVLQDILFGAGIHPRRKAGTFEEEDWSALYHSIRLTLQQMASQGGRDTERDLFGNPGGYPTKLSKLTVGKPCAECGQTIRKDAYLGGSIYYCPECQKQ